MQDQIVAIGKAYRHAAVRAQCRGVPQRGAEGRGHVQPDGRRQARPCIRWSRPNAGSRSSRNRAASGLPSSIAPGARRRDQLVAPRPATKAISAPASSSITWCRTPPPTWCCCSSRVSATSTSSWSRPNVRPIAASLSSSPRSTAAPSPASARRGLAHRQHGRLVGGIRCGVRQIRLHRLQRSRRGRHHRGGADRHEQPLAKGRPRCGAADRVSGGAGIWGADTVSMQGLKVPELSDGLQTEIKKLMPSYGAAGSPIDVTAQGAGSGGLQKSIDLLIASDEVDAILVVLSLSSEVRTCRSRRPSWKPVITAQNKPVVFYSYTLPSMFQRAPSWRNPGCRRAVGPDPCRRRDAAAGGRCEAQIGLPAGDAGLPLRDLSAHLASAKLSEWDSKSLLREGPASRCRTSRWLPTATNSMRRSARSGFPLVMKIQSGATSRTRARSAASGSTSRPRARRSRHTARCWKTPRSIGRGPGVSRACWSGRWPKRASRSLSVPMTDATFGPMIM